MSKHTRIHGMVDDFLAERRKSDGGWADITDKDMWELHYLIDALVKAKCEADPDGDRPIKWEIVNRKHQRLIAIRVPYEMNYQDALGILQAIQTLSEEIRCFVFAEGQK